MRAQTEKRRSCGFTFFFEIVVLLLVVEIILRFYSKKKIILRFCLRRRIDKRDRSGFGEGRASAGCVILVVRPEAAHWALADLACSAPHPSAPGPRAPLRPRHRAAGPSEQRWPRARYGPRSAGPAYHAAE